MSKRTGFHEFKVRVPDLPGMSIRDWQNYIDDAVRKWHGHAPLPVMAKLFRNVEEVPGVTRRMQRVKVTRILPRPRGKLRYVPEPVLTDEEKRALREVIQQADDGLPPKNRRKS